MSSDEGMLRTPSPRRRVIIPSLTHILREAATNRHPEQEELGNVFTESEDAVLLDTYAQATMIAATKALAPWKPECLPFGIANRIANLAVNQQQARGIIWRHPLKATRRRLTWLVRHQRLSSPYSPSSSVFVPPSSPTMLCGTDTRSPGPSSPPRIPTSRIGRNSSNSASPFIEQVLKKTKLSSTSSIRKKPMSLRSSRFNAHVVPLPRRRYNSARNDDSTVPTVFDEDGASDASSSGFRTPTLVARTLFQDPSSQLMRADSDDSINFVKGDERLVADSLIGLPDDENYEPASPCSLYSDMMQFPCANTILEYHTPSTPPSKNLTKLASPMSPLCHKTHLTPLLPFKNMHLEELRAGAISASGYNKIGVDTGATGNKTEVFACSMDFMHDQMSEGISAGGYGEDDQVINDEYY
ncbi:hypothetical protein SeMB42_g06589 [Synchytrium endobioticum]|uniref:Uncharacterized protein n=1 Tax=Synchytrium endobioticum TaxID=286115 RepID=A0A507CPW0_9FUNG|nr:hypothetical protein SeMB42_g06589 [Synchytrium endobioticum]TPX41176.1 hypothetical protein SeLEV6574_g06221 [Synchytrium endobioticum]